LIKERKPEKEANEIEQNDGVHCKVKLESNSDLNDRRKDESDAKMDVAVHSVYGAHDVITSLHYIYI